MSVPQVPPRSLPSLKLTATSPLKMDGWNTIAFPIGFRPIFRGKLLVSGSVTVPGSSRVDQLLRLGMGNLPPGNRESL